MRRKPNRMHFGAKCARVSVFECAVLSRTTTAHLKSKQTRCGATAGCRRVYRIGFHLPANEISRGDEERVARVADQHKKRSRCLGNRPGGSRRIPSSAAQPPPLDQRRGARSRTPGRAPIAARGPRRGPALRWLEQRGAHRTWKRIATAAPVGHGPRRAARRNLFSSVHLSCHLFSSLTRPLRKLFA